MAEIKTRIILRNDVTANWEAVKDTLVLMKGELAVEFDPSATGAARRRVKIGDGVTVWAQLPYFGETEATATEVYQVSVAAGADHMAAIAAAVGTATLNKGDIAIVKETIVDDKQQYTSYVYSGTAWAAMDGNYNAENVYFKNDFTYTAAIGVLPKPDSSATLAASGKNVKELLSSILAKEEQGTTTNPTLSCTSTNIGEKEVGTSIAVAYSISGTAGSYTYGPATGVTWSNYSATFNGETKTGASGTFTAVTVGDDTSLSISTKADHSAGAQPVTNLGNNTTRGGITAETNVSATKGTLTGYRNMFYGTMTTKPATMTSANIRSLTGVKYVAGAKTVDIPIGALRVVFAVPATHTVTSVKDVNGLNAEIFSSFSTTEINVEGANGYTAKKYNVYYLDYANANDTANKFTFTVKD